LKSGDISRIISSKEAGFMSYVFSTEKVGSVKLQNFHHSFGKNLVLAGIDGQTNDANTVINGINQLLSIVNFQNEYNPEDALRTVIQSVNSQE